MSSYQITIHHDSNALDYECCIHPYVVMEIIIYWLINIPTEIEEHIFRIVEGCISIIFHFEDLHQVYNWCKFMYSLNA